MYGNSLPPHHRGTTSDSKTTSAISIQEQLEPEQTRQLYQAFPLTLVASLIIALMLSTSHWNVVGIAEIIFWNLILSSTLLLRLVLWLCWKNLQQLYPTRFWLNCFRASAWLTGAAWGTASLLLFDHHNTLYQALLAFSLAGVATSSITTLAIDKYSSIGFFILTIAPLNLVMLLHDGPIAAPMSGMTLVFVFFVMANVSRARNTLEDQFSKQASLVHIGKMLDEKQRQEHIINTAQSIYINQGDIKPALENLLQQTLALCDSQLGLIGQVDKDSQGQPFMHSLIFSSSKSNDIHLSLFREQHLPPQGEFRNLNNIFGKIMLSGKTLISNQLSRDFRAATLPVGHPTINNFMGIPIFNGMELVAILGLANTTNSYNMDRVAQIDPLLKCISQFMQTLKHERQHEYDKAALETSNHQQKTILNDIADGVIMINKTGKIENFNHAAETIFGYRAEQIIGKNISELMPEPYKSMHDEHLQTHLRTGKKTILGVGREVQGLRRNGTEFPMDLMISRVERKGEPTFIGIIRDITEKKRIDELRSQFINNASKDLLEPLKLIDDAISLLNKRATEELPEHLKNITDIIKKNSHQLQKVIFDLAELQNFASTHQQFVLAAEPTLPLVEAAIKQQQYFGDIHRTKAIINECFGSFKILTNADRFKQALGYLLQYLYRVTQENSAITIKLLEDRGKIKVVLRSGQHRLKSTEREQLRTQLNQNTPISQAQYGEANELGLTLAKEIILKLQAKIELHESDSALEFWLSFPPAPSTLHS